MCKPCLTFWVGKCLCTTEISYAITYNAIVISTSLKPFSMGIRNLARTQIVIFHTIVGLCYENILLYGANPVTYF